MIIVLTICHNLCCLSQLVAMLLATIYVATDLCSGYHELDCFPSLRKKSPYSEFGLVCIFPAFGLNTERYSYLSAFSPNAGKYGKNADQNNSE